MTVDQTDKVTDTRQADTPAPRVLGFFTSFGGSLNKWEDESILDREILLPASFLRMGVFDRVSIFTYSHHDAELLQQMARLDPIFGKITVLPPPSWMPENKVFKVLYSILGPVLHRKALREATVLKTNQISGSWSALIGKLVTGRPLTLRFGYILSRRHKLNGKALAGQVSEVIEAVGYNLADKIVVTSENAMESVKQLTRNDNKIHLVPTYVDPSVFHPKTHYDFSTPVLYVGRFTAQKNLVNLIRACAAIKWELHLVGSGEQEPELVRVAQETHCRVSFLGRVGNTELAHLMQRYAVFALPSLHEGLPKVLIEAMASGLVCVGTNVPGTADLIVDGVSGYLIPDTSSDSIAQVLYRAITERKIAYGAAARAQIEAKFSIEKYVRAEAAILLDSAASQGSTE